MFCRKTIIAMEEKLNSKDFALKSSTNQLRKIKDELLEYQDAKKELDALKNQLEQVQAIEIMLTSNQADVQELLGKHPSSETLAYMISNLKRLRCFFLLGFREEVLSDILFQGFG